MKKRVISITALLLIVGLFLFISRGPNIANILKKNILPELETATGKKFIAQHAYVNIIPFFVELKGVKAFDENGNKILTAERVKGYISISGFFNKELLIPRLVIAAPDFSSNREQLNGIIENVKRYLASSRRHPLKTVVKSIEIKDGTVSFRDKDYRAGFKGLKADIALSGVPRFIVSAKEAVLAPKDRRELNGAIQAVFFLKGNEVVLEDLKLLSRESSIITKGAVGIDKGEGEVKANINIVIDTIKRIFGLKKRGEGKVSAEGIIRWNGDVKGIGSIFADLKVKGDMYLETLMELLGVREKLFGRMTVKGELKGYLDKLEAKADAELEKGGLFGVNVERLRCKITYENKVMHFTDGKAILYGGSALAEAHISLPSADSYSFRVKARDIHSKALFSLIGWDPRLSAGTVNGEISSSGSSFEPFGNFHYVSGKSGVNVLERISEAGGDFVMKGDVLHISKAVIATGKTNLSTDGNVDFSSKTLDFSGKGGTVDTNDLASPYFTAVSGPSTISVKVNGTFNDPIIRLGFDSRGSQLSADRLGFKNVFSDKTYRFNSVNGDILYKKDLLTVNELRVDNTEERIKVSGNIHFRRAKDIFDLTDPDYDLSLSLGDIDIKRFSGLLKKSLPLSGLLSANLKLNGRNDDIAISGPFQMEKAYIKGQYLVDSVKGRLRFTGGETSLDDLVLKKGQSVMKAHARFAGHNNFSLAADSKRLALGDFAAEKLNGKVFSGFVRSLSLGDVRIKGEGSFDEPNLDISGEVNAGTFKNYPVGKGAFKATLRGKALVLNAALLDGKLNIKADAMLTESFPWTLNAGLQPARYDFIIAGFMNDAPDDLILSLGGKITASGDKNHVKGVAKMNSAHLFLYGNSFVNSNEIEARLENNEVFIDKLSMKSEMSEVNLSGKLAVGKSYSILLEGSSSLAPVKAFSKSIDVLKGDSSFVFLVSGDWSNPKINGGMDIANGILGFKNIPYRFSAVSAYLYIDEDKIVMENASGKIAGGDIKANGTAYLQRFQLKKFYVESVMKGMTVSLSKDFWVSFDGNLFCRGTPESQSIMGDMAIKRARFTERIEWKTWLLKARSRETPKGEASRLENIALNIDVKGTNLKIDNNVARASMNMDLLLKGTIGRPIILGKVDTKEGFVYFRNNEFKILKTRLDFLNPNRIQPYFDIVAETKVTNYKVRLSLDGSLEQFNMSISSDPPLEESDIFSLLTVGYIGKNTKGLESGIGAGEATSFLTGKIQDVMEERLKTITGIDRVQIDPYVSRTTGGVTPRVTIAKRLGDKLFVTYGTVLGTVAEQVLKLEYHVSENTSIVGVRDEIGGLGGDVTFRFSFK